MAPNDMYPKYGRYYRGPCLKGSNACFDCGELCNKRMDCPRNRGKVRGVNMIPLGRGGPQGGAPRHNRLYALHRRQGVG